MPGMIQHQTLSAAQAQPAERATFIRRTYAHLAGAVAAFIGVEYVLLQTAIPGAMLNFIAGGRYNWLAILGGFMVLGWIARTMADGVRSVPAQYAGLAIYVVAEAFIFAPLLFIATRIASPDVLPTAAIMTGVLFAGLTAIVVISRKDFSFLGGILALGFMIALGLIVCSAIFGFDLGLIFSGAMVLLAAGAILYDTSRVLNHYGTHQHVAASLALFASVAVLFWYILQILLRLSRR